MRALPFIIGSKAFNRSPDCGLGGYDVSIGSIEINENNTISSDNDCRKNIERNLNVMEDTQTHFPNQSEFTVSPSAPPPPPLDPGLVNTKIFQDQDRYHRSSNILSDGKINLDGRLDR